MTIWYSSRTDKDFGGDRIKSILKPTQYTDKKYMEKVAQIGVLIAAV